MVTKEDLLMIIPKLHEDDIQSAHDYIRFLVHKRITDPETMDESHSNLNSVILTEPNGAFTWEDVANEICKKLSRPSFDTWFNRTSGEKVSSTTYLVRSETEFQKEWLESRYKKLISEVIEKINGRHLELEFTIERDHLTKGVV